MAAIYEPKGMAREYAALACNLYRGCMHGCTYCYAPSCLRMEAGEFWAGSVPRKDILQALAKDAPKYAGGPEPVLFCFTSDPYQPNESEHETTRKALTIMRDARCRFQVLTKGGLRATRDIDLFQQAGGIFGTTLLFTEDSDRREWEPGAASVEKRIAALAQFHEAGVRTWISIEPVVYPEQALELIRDLSPWVDEWRVGKLNHHPHAATVDWHDFARKAVEALGESGRDYMIKDALRPFLPPGSPVRHYVSGQVQHRQHRQ